MLTSKDVGSISGLLRKVPEVDLLATETASLSMTAAVAGRHRAAKKQNMIAFANLTTALDSPSLIGMLM